MSPVFQGDRLHPQWGDKLSLAECRRALAHFEESVERYKHWCDVSTDVFDDDPRPITDADRRFAVRSQAIAESRVVLWQSIIAAKERGELVQHLLHAAPRSFPL